MRKQVCLFFIVIFCLSVFYQNNASASEASRIQLSQVQYKLPDVTVYMDIFDEDGQPLRNVSPTQLTATIGSSAAQIKEIKTLEESGEGVAYILLIDISKSLKDSEFSKILESINALIDSMREYDKAFVITLGNEVKLVQDFTADKTVLQEKIAGLMPVDEKTQLHQGLVRAMEIGRRIDQALPEHRVIVTFSDGQDDFPGGLTRQEVLNKIKEDRVPIYSIGFYNPPLTPQKEEALNALGELTRASGGEYLQAETAPLEDIYSSMIRQIRQGFVLKLTCPDCRADGMIKRLQVTLSSGTKSVSDGVDIRLINKPEPGIAASNKQTENKIPWGLVAGSIVLLFAIGFGIGIVTRRRKKASVQEVGDIVPQAEEPPKEPIEFVAPDRKTGINIRLAVVGGTRQPRTFEARVTERITIGLKGGEVDLSPLRDNEIANSHCEISLDKNMFYIRNLNTGVNTLVNGVPINSRYRIQNSDIILLGRTELRFIILKKS